MKHAEIGIVGHIKAAMKTKRFSIRRLSVETGIPYRTLQNYLLEEHSMPAEVLGRICVAMGISADWVITDKLFIKSELMKKALDHAGIMPRDSVPSANTSAALTLIGVLNTLNDMACGMIKFDNEYEPLPLQMLREKAPKQKPKPKG